MRRAEGTFSLGRFDDEAPYVVQATGTGELSGVRGEGQIIAGPDSGRADTLDCGL